MEHKYAAGKKGVSVGGRGGGGGGGGRGEEEGTQVQWLEMKKM